MEELQKTNICCLDLTKECVDYLESLGLNVYEGSLGSVFSIKWGNSTWGSKPVLLDVDYPANLHEYHVFIHDMGNPRRKEYKRDEHTIKEVESSDERHLECHYPVTSYDLRPFGLHRITSELRRINKHSRIEVIFVGTENEVEYYSNVIGGNRLNSVGTFSNLEGWNLVSGTEKYGCRVKLEDNKLSKTLFNGRLTRTKYYRVFSLPTEIQDDKRVIDQHYISLLKNEGGECVSYLCYYNDSFIRIVLPQVDDKVGLLKDLFESVLFRFCSEFFPDIEARNWIHGDAYLLPEERVIKDILDSKREEYEKEINKLEEEQATVHRKNNYLKQILIETGDTLVKAVKTYLEWLGFENVIDKDETLKEGDIKEEDLLFDYEGIHFILEVKGINGTSTDAECSQVDKIVNRRMRKLKTTDVHGVYIVNNERNIEPIKRTMPPFNDNQIKDAEGQCRTIIYSTQLFALFSDIENGYVTKEAARESFMRPGLVDFHSGLITLGIPYNYFQNDTVICLELSGNKVSLGDMLFYKDSLGRLVGFKVESIQKDKESLEFATNGKVGIKVKTKVPRNKIIYI